jgi:hypothetical protein
MKVIKPALVLSCVLFFGCKSDKVQHNTKILKYKPAACCSSNLPSRFGLKKLTDKVRLSGDDQVL